jgi:hypothetical protein
MNSPAGVYNTLDKEVMSWTQVLMTTPHRAYEREDRLRTELKEANRREIDAGLRRLDTSPGLGEEAAMERLVNHQIAELTMMIGHMDGLGRVLTIVHLEVEKGVQIVEGELQEDFRIKPELDDDGMVKYKGYFNNRPGVHEVLKNIDIDGVGVSKAVLTLNELMVNPDLCEKVKSELKAGRKPIEISSEEASDTGEF